MELALCTLMRSTSYSFSSTQVMNEGLSDYIKIEEMHFTHIRRRILKIKPQLNLGSVDDSFE